MSQAGGRPRARTRSFSLTGVGYHLLAVVTITLLGLAVYARSLDGPFVFDDLNGIAQNRLLHSLTPLSRFLVLSTRPLTDFSYALSYAVGEMDPWPFHAISLLLHVLNAVLLYSLALRTLELAGSVRCDAGQRRLIAWAAAALFVTHPMTTESVAYLSSRSEVLVAFFYLLTLRCYVAAATTPRRSVRVAGAVVK